MNPAYVARLEQLIARNPRNRAALEAELQALTGKAMPRPVPVDTPPPVSVQPPPTVLQTPPPFDALETRKLLWADLFGKDEHLRAPELRNRLQARGFPALFPRTNGPTEWFVHLLYWNLLPGLLAERYVSARQRGQAHFLYAPGKPGPAIVPPADPARWVFGDGRPVRPDLQ